MWELEGKAPPPCPFQDIPPGIHRHAVGPRMRDLTASFVQQDDDRRDPGYLSNVQEAVAVPFVQPPFQFPGGQHRVAERVGPRGTQRSDGRLRSMRRRTPYGSNDGRTSRFRLLDGATEPADGRSATIHAAARAGVWPCKRRLFKVQDSPPWSDRTAGRTSGSAWPFAAWNGAGRWCASAFFAGAGCARHGPAGRIPGAGLSNSQASRLRPQGSSKQARQWPNPITERSKWTG